MVVGGLEHRVATLIHWRVRMTVVGSFRIVVAAALTIGVALPAMASGGEAAARPVYELRIYPCAPGKLEPLNKRFRDHTMKLFEKHGG